jgi:glycosyltransferase involved in cell wall biosynthesis
MRVAVFTETFSPSVNGIVTLLLRTLPLLADAGDEVLLFAPGAAADDGQLRVVGLRGFGLPLYPEIRVAPPRIGLGRHLDAFGPDVVHVVNPAMLGMAGIFHARRLGVPLVASFHTHLPRYLRHYHLGAFEGWAWGLLRTVHNRADVNLCISEGSARELADHGFRNVNVGWRGGVDASLMHPSRRSQAMRRRMGGVDERTPILLYVGRLSAEKGVERLLPLLHAVPGARLALVGDGPHRQALEQHFAGTPTRLLGYLAGQELAAAYASADLFVFPSLTDVLPLVVLEAMAAGCPVVAPHDGGIPELVEHARTGLLFDPGVEASMVACALRLLQPSAERDSIREDARTLAESMSWPAAATDLRRAYAEAADARRSRSTARLAQPRWRRSRSERVATANSALSTPPSKRP